MPSTKFLDNEHCITKQWNGEAIPNQHNQDVDVKLNITLHEEGLQVEFEAPLFLNPRPPMRGAGKLSPSGLCRSVEELWDYEVVEVFFLDADDKTCFEAEFAPFGEYLAVQLAGPKQIASTDAELEYRVVVENGLLWKGTCLIPWRLIPSKLAKFNCYAIHGGDDGMDRIYKALAPVPAHLLKPTDTPNFHRFNTFITIDDESIEKISQKRPSMPK